MVLTLVGAELHFEQKGYWIKVGSSLIHLGFILFVLDFIVIQYTRLHLYIFWLSTIALSGGCFISFYVPDLMFTVVDPLRPGHEVEFHPGEVNARMCHAFVLNKLNSAKPEDVKIVEDNMKLLNPNAAVIRTNSKVTVESGKEGKQVVDFEKSGLGEE